MLATRMFFWWNTAFIDPLTPVQTVPASARSFEVPGAGRVFTVPATDRLFEIAAE